MKLESVTVNANFVTNKVCVPEDAEFLTAEFTVTNQIQLWFRTREPVNNGIHWKNMKVHCTRLVYNGDVPPNLKPLAIFFEQRIMVFVQDIAE